MSHFLSDKIKNKRSQYLGTFYRLNGAIYIGKVFKVLGGRVFFLKENIFSYMMERKDSIDIDEELDSTMTKVLIGAKQAI